MKKVVLLLAYEYAQNLLRFHLEIQQLHLHRVQAVKFFQRRGALYAHIVWHYSYVSFLKVLQCRHFVEEYGGVDRFFHVVR